MAMYLLLVFALQLLFVESLNPEFGSVQCDHRELGAGNPFARNIGVVVRDLIESTGAHPNKEYKNISPSPSSFVYGYGKCKPDSSPQECKSCLESLSSTLPHRCGSAAGARASSINCLLRYEDHPFGAEEDPKLLPGSSAGYALQ